MPAPARSRSLSSTVSGSPLHRGDAFASRGHGHTLTRGSDVIRGRRCGGSRARRSARSVSPGLLVTGVARAADEDPEALIQQAVELRRKGDNARAYGYLKRAYDLARTPRSAAQLGLVEHALGRFPDAEVHLGEALATGRSVGRGESIPAGVESRGRAQQARSGRDRGGAGRRDPQRGNQSAPSRSHPIASSTWRPASARLRVEGPGLASVAKTVAVSVSKTVTITVEASQGDRAFAVGGGGRGNHGRRAVGAPPAAESSAAGGPGASAEARDGAPPAAAPDRSSGRGLRIAGLGIAGGGLALGVAGIFVRGAATTKLDAIAGDARNKQPYNESNGNWQDLDRAGVAMIVTGGVAVVAGTVLVSGQPDVVRVVLLQHGAGVHARDRRRRRPNVRGPLLRGEGA